MSALDLSEVLFSDLAAAFASWVPWIQGGAGLVVGAVIGTLVVRRRLRQQDPRRQRSGARGFPGNPQD
ncbi:hypothetical protein GCM10027294_03890 [Marinactinospora endophytica]